MKILKRIFSLSRIMPKFKNSKKDSEKELKKKNNEMIGQFAGIRKIFPQSNEPISLDDSDFNNNLDNKIDEITRAKEVEGYISRVLANFREKAVKTGFYFESEKKENIDKVKNRLENILINSGSSTEMFLQECFSNYSSFGNVFVHKAINPLTEEIEKLTILPSKGWTPKKSYGVKVVEWEFNAGEITKKYTTKNVFHLFYEKETHHVFGVPVVNTALNDASILRELEGEMFQAYLDSLNTKTMLLVGDNNSKASQAELDEVTAKMNTVGPNEDYVLGGHIRIETIKPEFDPNGLQVVDAAKNRVLSSLRSSGTSVGEKGAGRQDADTLDSQDDVVVEDLQFSLENQLNVTIIRQICIELFGEVTAENQVKIRFNKTFTTKERKEKHDIFKFLSGAITIEELRAALGEADSFDEDRLYQNLFAKEEGTTLGEASVKTNPTNQHGSKGNSKKSVKN